MNDDRRSRRELITINASIGIQPCRREKVDLLRDGGRRLEVPTVLINVVIRFVTSVDRSFGLRTRREILAAHYKLGATPALGLLRLESEDTRLVNEGNATAKRIRSTGVGRAIIS